jgi:aspartyl-tRNA(Asn)/glutamyl-tRNA(Gln) amidotransferase subunit A
MAERGFGPLDSEVMATVKKAACRLKDLGCTVEPVSIGGLEKRDWNLISGTLFAAEACVFFEPIIGHQHEKLHPILQSRLATRQESLSPYFLAQAEVEILRNELAEYFSRYDLLLCPTTCVPAHPHNAPELVINGQTLPSRNVVRTTVPFSLTGHPALSVPFGHSHEGLPIGVQLVGRRFEEPTVLRAGMALESSETVKRRPPL